jgi:integrase
MSTWGEEIEQHLQWMRAGAVSDGTARCRRYYLERLAAVHGDCSPWDLTTDDLARFVGQPGWGAETRKSARASLRRFYGWAHLTRRITDDPAMRLPSVRVPIGAPRPAPPDVVRRALELAHDDRQRAWVLLARLAGLRRGEIATVRVEHLTKWPEPELLVIGKGGRGRVVPVHPMLLDQLERLPSPGPAGWLFPGQDNGHVSPPWVGKVLGRLLGPGWTGHTLRHAAATSWYAVERDLRATQELLGHARPETTMRYTRVPDGARRAAVLGGLNNTSPGGDGHDLMRRRTG